jgi:glucose-6-phosphate 1-dehydrogenase
MVHVPASTPAARDAVAQPSRIAIFGITGDLAVRYLVPALAALEAAGRLPENLEIIGVGRSEVSEDALRTRLREGVGGRRLESPVVDRITYRRAGFGDAAALRDILGGEDPTAIYLAIPPALLEEAIGAVRRAGPAPGTRIVVEKPFGESLESARRLNGLLHDAFPEESVFRVDHFLHKQTVQNLLGIRFANRVFEPLWNRESVARVEIRWDEHVGLEGRAGYYDRAGALRDMIQNHLLQLASLVGMEAPATMTERDLRDRKVEFLRAVRRASRDEVVQDTVRARYAAGAVGDEELPSYVDEEGVDPARGTETFAEVTLHVDNWRWADVPFILRTGKAIGHPRREIVVRYRDVPHLAFGADYLPRPNVLRLELNPDRIALGLNVNGAGDPFDLEELELGADLAPEGLPAYARVLLAVLEGDPILSIRADEAEESWRIVEPILHAWAADAVPMLEYPAGSHGPAESHLGADADSDALVASGDTLPGAAE